MSEIPVVLFPHCTLTDRNLKRIRFFFNRVTICQPWFMEEPLPVFKRDEASFIDVFHPPVSLKPQKDFKRLLAEYLLWIRQNQDRGYASFLGVAQKIAPSEDTQWEIRQMMHQMEVTSPAFKEKNHALKWHFILHLARIFEENLTAADDILKHLKQQKSPLEEALAEQTQSQNRVEYIPQSEIDLFFDDHHLQQVFEAWFGLFGETLTDQAILITQNRHVIEYVKALFEDKIIRLSKAPAELVSSSVSSKNLSDFIPYHIPHLTDDTSKGKNSVLTGLAGRTLALLEN